MHFLSTYYNFSCTFFLAKICKKSPKLIYPFIHKNVPMRFHKCFSNQPLYVISPIFSRFAKIIQTYQPVLCLKKVDKIHQEVLSKLSLLKLFKVTLPKAARKPIFIGTLSVNLYIFIQFKSVQSYTRSSLVLAFSVNGLASANFIGVEHVEQSQIL